MTLVQFHHLIPNQYKDHNFLTRISEFNANAYDHEAATNKIKLPKEIADAVDLGLSRHIGSHPAYSGFVGRVLDKFNADLDDALADAAGDPAKIDAAFTNAIDNLGKFQLSLKDGLIAQVGPNSVPSHILNGSDPQHPDGGTGTDPLKQYYDNIDLDNYTKSRIFTDNAYADHLKNNPQFFEPDAINPETGQKYTAAERAHLRDANFTNMLEKAGVENKSEFINNNLDATYQRLQDKLGTNLDSYDAARISDIFKSVAGSDIGDIAKAIGKLGSKIIGPEDVAIALIAAGIALTVSDEAFAEEIDYQLGELGIGAAFGVGLLAFSLLLPGLTPYAMAIIAPLALAGLVDALEHLFELFQKSPLGHQVAELFEGAAGLIDPLVIDLDGDGVTTTSVDQSTAYFDLDNNGVAERAGWIEPEDGFVVYDWNSDGTINNRSEQFATFDELARHDTNGDGVVSAADTAQTKLMDLDGDGLLENVTLGYDSLKIWVDANSDGKTDEGELKTLEELGISSIDLNKTDIQQTNNGNELNAKSTVTFDDGSVADIYGVSFDRVTTDTDFSARIDALDTSPEYLTPRADAFILPNLAGSGNVPPLLVAALESDAVLDTWRAASQFDVNDTNEFMLRVQQLVIDWAGVGHVDPGGADEGNLRHLAAMEAFAAQEFGLTTRGPRGEALDEGWDAFVAGVGLRIALQTDTDFNPGGLIAYDPRTDSFSGDFTGFLAHLCNLMFNEAATSSFDNQGLEDLVQALWQSVGDQLTVAETSAFDGFFQQAFTYQPQSVSSTFFANSKYYDPEFNFSLDPDYQFLKAVANLTVLSNGDLIIHLADVDTDFHDYEGGDYKDKLYDLTLHDAGALMGDVTQYNEHVSGDGHAYYGMGDDYYAGGDGSDTYYVTAGVGYDTIFESNVSSLNEDDVDLILVGHSQEDTTLTRDGDDLFISWGNSGGIVLVKDQFKFSHAIEGIVFGGAANSDITALTQFDADWIKANAWYRGSAGRDALTGTDDDETFHGGKGDDLIDVGSGVDTIVYKSGDGNDIIRGGGSSTTLNLEGLTPTDIFLFIREETLYIEDTKTGHIITVEDQFAGAGLTAIAFGDGQSWDRATIESQAIVVGTEFGDEFLGSGRADTYWGREGDDTLRGGQNGDTYVYTSGDGNDFIHEWVFDTGHDVLKLTDLSLADIRFTRGNANDGTQDDLFITILLTGEVITVPRQFNGLVEGGVESIEFSDGSSIDEAGMLARLEMVGTDQNEILHGSYSADEITGGLGDDAIYGGAEGDTYLYRTGDGSDFIYESLTGTGNDVLKLTDMTLEDVYLSSGNADAGTQNDLFITVKATGEVITIADQFHPTSAGGVEFIEFSDGTQLDSAGITAHLVIIGTDQAETLRGGHFGEEINGGKGNDTLYGNDGGDTYIYASGDGNDFINEVSSNSGVDVLRFTDLSFLDVEFKQGTHASSQGYNLILTVKSTGETVIVSDNANGNAGNGLERVEFSDGTVLVPEEISALATFGAVDESGFIAGSELADSLIGTSANETFTGNSGNDFLQGKNGSDTYVFARGDGNDTIHDSGNGGTDALRIKGYVPGEVSLQRSETGYDLVLKFFGTSDQITIVNTLNGNPADQVEKIVFDNNTVWTMADIRGTLLSQAKTDGADDIEGFFSGDVLEGGLGNDVLSGASGNDTYVFKRGDGNDIVVEETLAGSSDKLHLADINPNEVRLRLDDNDLTLVVLESSLGAGDGGWIRLSRSYSEFFDRGVELIEFADGTIWDRPAFQAVLANQTNVAPVVANPIENQTIAEDAEWSFTIPSDRFSDADQDLLTFSATLADGTPLPSWVSIDGYTGTFSGTPPQDFHGTISLKVTATDGTLTVDDVFDLIVSPVNDAPIVASGIPSQAANETQAWSYIVPQGTFMDVDGDALTLSATLADGTPLPSWLNFDAASGTFAGTPPQGTLGTLSLKVIAFDGVVSTATLFDVAIGEAPAQFIDIAGTNQNDTLIGTSSDEVIAGLAGDDTINGGSGNDTYLYSLGDGNDTITETFHKGSADRLELGAGILASEVTLELSQTDADDITLHFSDGGSILLDEQFAAPFGFQHSGVESIVFDDGTVWDKSQLLALEASQNSAPTLSSALMDQSGTEGEALNFTIPTDAFADADGDALTYSATLADGSPLPSWLSFDAATRTFYGTPSVGVAGTLALLVTVSDGSAAASDTFDLVIEAPTSVVVDIAGTSSNDTLSGTSTSEVITGYEGNDTINGGSGNDTYLYDLGDGNDTITETYNNGSADRLELGDGILASQVTIVRSTTDTDDVTLHFADGGSIMLDEQFHTDFSRQQSGVEQIVFADGTIWGHDDLLI